MIYSENNYIIGEKTNLLEKMMKQVDVNVWKAHWERSSEDYQ